MEEKREERVGGRGVIEGVGIAVTKSMLAPFERVKLHIQCQREMLRYGKLKKEFPHSIFSCLRRIVAKEGVVALYRGNGANVIRYVPTQLLNFYFKTHFKHSFHSFSSTLLQNFLAGAIAGLTTLTITYPLDYARTRLANDITKKGSGREFRGIRDVLSKSWEGEGVVGVYRGFNVSCVGVMVYRGAYFGLFDTLEPLLGNYQKEFVPRFGLGYVVVNASAFVSYPFDTIRRRMMMTSLLPSPYSSSFSCFWKIISNESFFNFFAGYSANRVRSLSAAGLLAGFEKLHDYLK